MAPPNKANGAPDSRRRTAGEGLRNRGVRIRTWSEEEFLDRRVDYEDLLSRSNADPLFMSWHWLTTWWTLQKGPLDLTLEVFAAETDDGRVLGLAPMTLRQVRHRGGPGGRRLEPLGNLWRQAGAPLTEYVTFPADSSSSFEITRGLVESIFDSPGWDDLCLSFMPQESDSWHCILSHAEGLPDVYVRSVETITAHTIDLKEGFEAFLGELGSKTRLRVFNGRKRLSKLGTVDFVVCDDHTFDEGLRILDRLNEERRGKPLFTGSRGEFYRRIAGKALEEGTLALSHLTLEEEPLAAALNLRAGDREYGIALGIGMPPPKGVSPGYLQIGFMVEQCCSDGIRFFDFLAGKDTAKDYRKHFPTEVSKIGHAQIVRGRLLGALYRSYDAAMRRVGRAPSGQSGRIARDTPTRP